MSLWRSFDSRIDIPLGHLHNGADLVTLAHGLVAETCLDLVVVLDQGTARTPIRRAAVGSSRPFDAKSVAYLLSLRHVASARVRSSQSRCEEDTHIYPQQGRDWGRWVRMQLSLAISTFRVPDFCRRAAVRWETRYSSAISGPVPCYSSRAYGDLAGIG